MKKVLVVALCLLMVFGAIAGCSGNKTNSADAFAKVIKIGVNYELTGSSPIIGESAKKGLEIAKDEINSKGGVEINGEKYGIDLEYLDNGYNGEEAATVAQTFADNEQIVAMIGPNDSEMCDASKQIVESEGLPTITPWATQVDITEGKYFFRACFTDDFQGEILAKYAYNTMGARTAACMFDSSCSYNVGISKIFKKVFEGLGGKVLSYESYNGTAGDTDFTAQFTKIIAANPDVTLLPNFYEEVVNQAEQARSLGYKGKFLGSDTWGDVSMLKADTNNLLADCVWCGHYHIDVANAAAKSFIAKYQEVYGKDETPNDIAALNYDALNIVVLAIKNAQSTDRAAIRDGLASIDIYEGVTGTVSYKDSKGNPGDPSKSAVLIQIKQHEGSTETFEYLDTIQP